jgi:hypothetical protein
MGQGRYGKYCTWFYNDIYRMKIQNEDDGDDNDAAILGRTTVSTWLRWLIPQ